MRYVIAIPIITIVASGLVWWMSRGQIATSAHEHAPVLAPVKATLSARPTDSGPRVPQPPAEGAASYQFDPIRIAPCTLAPLQEQDVSSEIDGLLDEVAAALGQKVARGQLLARLDDRKLRLQVELLKIRAESRSAERIAQALFDEADAKVKYAEKANRDNTKAVPELEYKTYLANRERFAQEIQKAREEREQAHKELEKATLLLQLHEIRSGLAGEVVRVFKKPGETVKQSESLFRIARLDSLRIEGFCHAQHAPLLRVGMTAVVEPEVQGAQLAELVGHTATINDLAISRDGKLLASASDDETVLLWSWPGGQRIATLPHPAAVLSVDVVPAAGSAQEHLVATGCADGVVRLWRVLPRGAAKLAAAMVQHDGPVRAVRLSPDGLHLATGGEDRRIGWWNVSSRRFTFWVHAPGAFKQSAHQGAITDLHFGEGGVLVSAASDNTQRVWKIDAGAAALVQTHRGRAGDVLRPGLSADGRLLLFDHADELWLLGRETGEVLGTLRCGRNSRFKDFARFSPTGRLIVSASADGIVQLWRAPATGTADREQHAPPPALVSLLPGVPGRPAMFLAAFAASAKAPGAGSIGGFELRHYKAPRAAEVKCGVFAPDESVFFTAGADRTVRVWSVPPAAEWQPREASLTYVGSEIEPGTDLVRIQAIMDNRPDRRQPLRAGTFVTLKVYPQRTLAGRSFRAAPPDQHLSRP